MLHTSYNEQTIYDQKIAINNAQDLTVNFFGLPKQSLIYGDLTLEPFQLIEAGFLGDEVLNEESSFTIIDYNETYKYKPQYVAQEYYGNPRLAYLILYANKLTDVTQFTNEYLNGKIRIINLSVLLSISAIFDSKSTNEPKTVIVTDSTAFDF